MNEQLFDKRGIMIKASIFDLILFEKKKAFYSNKHFLKGLIAAILRGVGYRKNFEYPWVLNNLQIKEKDKILDIGCGNSPLSLFLASKGVEITAVDIREDVIEKYINIAQSIGLKKAMMKGTLTIKALDARKLPYPDEYFDKIYAISSLEHFREKGDIECIKEMSRVLKPAGYIGITVPFSKRFFEKESTYYVPYYEKRYDFAMLNERIIIPSALDVVKIDYANEKIFKFHRFFYTKGKWFRYSLGNFIPFFSKIFYGNIKLNEDADIACIILRKRDSNI